MKKLAIGLLVLIAGTGIAAVMLLSADPWIPDGEVSKGYFTSGQYSVGSLDIDWTDQDRETMANGDFAGSAQRPLSGRVWYPASAGRIAPGRHPLIIYSHGFMSNFREGTYLAEYVATHGYITIAVNYPLTNYFAPGGPNLADVVSQPGDVSFLIDMATGDPSTALPGHVDPDRIAAVGLSLGGLTTQLATYHPRWRDPRIAAAVSIGGPTAMFTESFYAVTDTPMMMVAGDIDAMIHYDLNGPPLLDKDPTATLVTLQGASHTGFADIASKLLRFYDNPDSLGCSQIMDFIDPDTNPFAGLFEADDGVVFDPADARLPCDTPLPDLAMPPGQQQTLTALATLAFLDMHVDPDPQIRAGAFGFLKFLFERENPQVKVFRGPPSAVTESIGIPATAAAAATTP